MLRFPSDHVEYRINFGNNIFEFFCLVVHDRVGPQTAHIVEIIRPRSGVSLQPCMFRKLQRVCTDISSGPVDEY